MSKFPLVSIIVPSYNGEKFIAKAIRSVLLQTYKNWELIIVEDGYTDKTEEIVDSFLDKRINYIKKEHSGISKTRNVGIKEANGEYIAFLDQDDVWLPEKLSVQIEYMQKSDSSVGLVYCKNYVLQNGKIIMRKREKGGKAVLVKEYFFKSGILPSSVLLSRKCLFEVGLFDEKLELLEDYDLWIRVSNRYKFLYLNKPLFIYVLHKGQYHRNKLKMIKSREYVHKKYEHILKGHNNILSSMYFRNGHGLFELGDAKKGRYYLIKAIKASNFSAKCIFAYLLSLLGNKTYRLFFYIKRYISRRFFLRVHPDSGKIVKYYEEL